MLKIIIPKITILNRFIQVKLALLLAKNSFNKKLCRVNICRKINNKVTHNFKKENLIKVYNNY
jgi:hypothetical protein